MHIAQRYAEKLNVRKICNHILHATVINLIIWYDTIYYNLVTKAYINKSQ